MLIELVTGFQLAGAPELFGNDIWSDGGFGAPITPRPSCHWCVSMDKHRMSYLNLQFYKVKFLVSHIQIPEPHLMQTDSVFCSNQSSCFPGCKFYANGRSITGVGDIGWWVREYFWDFLVAVDITGDTPPDINSIAGPSSGLDAGPFTVDANITDANPGNPANAGVASAKLFWSIDGGTTWNEVAMTGAEPNFSAV